MNTKKMATPYVREYKAFTKYHLIYRSMFLIVISMIVISCAKSDDIEVSNDEFVIDYSNSDDTPFPDDIQIANSQESKIIYTDIEPDFKSGIIENFYNLDLNNDGNIDFKFSSFITDTSAVFAEPNINTNRINAFAAVAGPFWSYVIPLDGPDIIKPTASSYFYDSSDCLLYMNFCSSFRMYCSYSWEGKTDKYIGLRFLINGQSHYGWARLDVTNTTKWVIKDYAYNATPNMAINVGQKE